MLSAAPFNLTAVLDRVDEAIDANAEIADRIVEAAMSTGDFELESESVSSNLATDSTPWQGTATPHHIDKARSTIRQMNRDWSVGGATERRACYDPVLQDLELEFSSISDKGTIRVLVPGAGLGRLVFEICLKGYTVEGNEISWHQLMAGSWVLNHTTKGETYDLYPFAEEFSNVRSRDHQLQGFQVPDVHPGSALEEASVGSRRPCTERLAMTAGDFIDIYMQKKFNNAFEAVVTVFFIDTAPNVIKYIETIRNCLKIGGIWTNLGPLLWHFADRAPAEREGDGGTSASGSENAGVGEAGSVELTNEDVLSLVERMGFKIEKKETSAATGYNHNAASMLQSTYRPSHWVARKSVHALSYGVDPDSIIGLLYNSGAYRRAS